MINQTIKTTNGRLRISMPTQLHEVTLGQLISMQEQPDMNDLEAISILSGTPVSELKQVANFNDLHVFGAIVLNISQQIKYLYQVDKIPAKVTFTIDEEPVQVNTIRNLSVEPAGAFMAAREIIADEINAHIKQYGGDDWQETFNPSLKACCLVLAHYFFCRATGKRYDEYEAEQFTVEIKKMRVTEALPIARHFFTNYPDLSKPKTGFWHPLLQHLKKRRVFMPLSGLNISIPSIP